MTIQGIQGSAVNTNGAQNVSEKKKMDPALKGALIGGGIGAATQGAWSAYIFKDAKNMIGTQDTFIKNAVDEVSASFKDLGIKAPDGAIAKATENGKEAFKRAQNTLSQIKKAIPKHIAISALVIGGIGAGIGLIVKAVKNNKAEKSE